jgi:hypothetical protein
MCANIAAFVFLVALAGLAATDALDACESACKAFSCVSMRCPSLAPSRSMRGRYLRRFDSQSTDDPVFLNMLLSWCLLRLRLMGLQCSQHGNLRHHNEALPFSDACNKQLAATCQCDKSASFFGRRVTYSPASRKVCNASPLASVIGSSNFRDHDIREGVILRN